MVIYIAGFACGVVFGEIVSYLYHQAIWRYEYNFRFGTTNWQIPSRNFYSFEGADQGSKLIERLFPRPATFSIGGINNTAHVSVNMFTMRAVRHGRWVELQRRVKPESEWVTIGKVRLTGWSGKKSTLQVITIRK